MKKTTRFLALFLALIAIFALPSCSSLRSLFSKVTSSEKKKASQLITKINDQMSSYDSFELAMTMDIKYFIDDVEANAHTEGKQITTGLVSGDFQTYTRLEIEISSDNADEKQKISSKEGYFDGKYFLTTKGDYYNQKIYSPLTAQEAYEFVMESGVSFSGYLDCQNAQASTKDNGDFLLVCSGYTEAAIENICDYFGVDDSVFDTEIADVNVSITADSSYRVSEVSLDFIFEEAEKRENASEIKIVEQYFSFDEAYIYPAMVNLENHTEVYDIRVLKAIDDMLDDLYDSSYGSFDLSISQTEEAAGQTETREGSSKVVYGRDENGYFFNIDDEVSEQTTKYKDGYQSTVDSQGFHMTSEAKTEFEAKNYIASLINTGGFSVPSVTDIKKVSDGVYEFSCANNLIYEKVNQGFQLNGVNQTITFTVENGKIVKIVSNVYVTGVYIYAQYRFSTSISIDSTVDFQPQKSDNDFLSVKSNENFN